MQQPVAPVFTWPSDDPQLIGSRCEGCGAVTFPMQSRLSRAWQPGHGRTTLPRRGTLVSWTTQGFPPSFATWAIRQGRPSSRSGWAWFSSMTWCASRPG